MNSITAINTVRDSLRTNLTDPYVTGGGSVRGGAYWIFADEPVSSPKYPIIQIKKISNPSIPIDIGSEYTEYEQLFLAIWFQTKNGFKITVGSTDYVNASLVEYYQGLIKTTLKAQFNTLHTAGVKMYKHTDTSPIGGPDAEQLYFGNVIIRVAYFNR